MRGPLQFVLARPTLSTSLLFLQYDAISVKQLGHDHVTDIPPCFSYTSSDNTLDCNTSSLDSSSITSTAGPSNICANHTKIQVALNFPPEKYQNSPHLHISQLNIARTPILPAAFFLELVDLYSPPVFVLHIAAGHASSGSQVAVVGETSPCRDEIINRYTGFLLRWTSVAAYRSIGQKAILVVRVICNS